MQFSQNRIRNENDIILSLTNSFNARSSDIRKLNNFKRVVQSHTHITFEIIEKYISDSVGDMLQVVRMFVTG